MLVKFMFMSSPAHIIVVRRLNPEAQALVSTGRHRFSTMCPISPEHSCLLHVTLSLHDKNTFTHTLVHTPPVSLHTSPGALEMLRIARSHSPLEKCNNDPPSDGY